MYLYVCIICKFLVNGSLGATIACIICQTDCFPCAILLNKWYYCDKMWCVSSRSGLLCCTNRGVINTIYMVP